MFWGSPLWLKAILLSIVVILLQQSPYTGIFLMMLLAPWWSAALVNVALLSMIWDALSGTASRWLLIVPVAVYAFSAVASAMSYLDHRALAHRVAEKNDTQAATFSPQTQALIADEGLASSLARNFMIDVVYAPNSNVRPFQHLSHRVLPRSCSTVSQNPRQFIFRFGVHIRGQFTRRWCELRQPEDPKGTRITAGTDVSKTESRFFRASLSTTKLEAAGHTAATIITGRSEILPPIPLPVIGCSLNDAAGKWDCFWHFQRVWLSIGPAANGYGEDARAIAIAAALKLEQRTVSVQ